MISDILLFFGLILVVIGSFGFLKMKDFFSNLQAISISDTVGLFTIVIALIIKYPEHFAKLLIIALLILITDPITSHVVALGATRAGLKVGEKKK
jgi:multicomponent Na+:H+ antiporter subunit G